jgi:hypothetical protein
MSFSEDLIAGRPNFFVDHKTAVFRKLSKLLPKDVFTEIENMPVTWVENMYADELVYGKQIAEAKQFISLVQSALINKDYRLKQLVNLYMLDQKPRKDGGSSHRTSKMANAVDRAMAVDVGSLTWTSLDGDTTEGSIKGITQLFLWGSDYSFYSFEIIEFVVVRTLYALCLRHKIARTGFTQNSYNEMTRIWNTAFSPVHPDDKEIGD